MSLQGSDEELVVSYQRASVDARRAIADELFARHYERVARWCYRFTGERESAADLAQEVFIKAHRHLESFQGTARFTTWLYAIVRNESLNWLRSNKAALMEDEDVLADTASMLPGPEEMASRNSSARRLHEILQTTLDETERIVFTLHYGDGMPLDAISRMLSLDNASGAKAFIVSARRKLARAAARLVARGERL
jgi:RNA polymerase sigma-70 factor (ECF subfamily)